MAVWEFVYPCGGSEKGWRSEWYACFRTANINGCGSGLLSRSSLVVLEEEEEEEEEEGAWWMIFRPCCIDIGVTGFPALDSSMIGCWENTLLGLMRQPGGNMVVAILILLRQRAGGWID